MNRRRKKQKKTQTRWNLELPIQKNQQLIVMSNSYKGSYGFSAEVQQRQAAKYDKDLENTLREWIEDKTGKKIGSDFAEGLKSGVILCQLLNKIVPKTVKGINKKAKMPFHCMENITKFLKGCRALGVPEHSMFSTVDLYEAKNMTAVLLTLDNLAREVTGRTEPVNKKAVTRYIHRFR